LWLGPPSFSAFTRGSDGNLVLPPSHSFSEQLGPTSFSGFTHGSDSADVGEGGSPSLRPRLLAARILAVGKGGSDGREGGEGEEGGREGMESGEGRREGKVRHGFYRAPARLTDKNANATLLRQVAPVDWHSRLAHLLGTHAYTKVTLDLCTLHRFCSPRKMAIATRKMTAT
jgi:hypothetical protein